MISRRFALGGARAGIAAGFLFMPAIPATFFLLLDPLLINLDFHSRRRLLNIVRVDPAEPPQDMSLIRRRSARFYRRSQTSRRGFPFSRYTAFLFSRPFLVID